MILDGADLRGEDGYEESESYTEAYDHRLVVTVLHRNHVVDDQEQGGRSHRPKCSFG
jgi:hypothetical protein